MNYLLRLYIPQFDSSVSTCRDYQMRIDRRILHSEHVSVVSIQHVLQSSIFCIPDLKKSESNRIQISFGFSIPYFDAYHTYFDGRVLSTGCQLIGNDWIPGQSSNIPDIMITILGGFALLVRSSIIIIISSCVDLVFQEMGKPPR